MSKYNPISESGWMILDRLEGERIYDPSIVVSFEVFEYRRENVSVEEFIRRYGNDRSETFYRAELVITDAYDRDAHGYTDTLNIANYRVLSDELASFQVSESTGYASNVHPLAIDLDYFDFDESDDPADMLDHLADTLVSHCDYPAGADDEMSNVESELLDEWVDDELISDIHFEIYHAVNRSTGLTDRLSDASDAQLAEIKDMFWEWMNDNGVYPEWEYCTPYWVKSEFAEFALTVARYLYRNTQPYRSAAVA